MLGNALETAHSAGIQLKTITSVWDTEAIEIIESAIEEACKSSVELEQMIDDLENTK